MVRSSCWSNYRTNGQQFTFRPVGGLSQYLVMPPLQSNQRNLVKDQLLIIPLVVVLGIMIVLMRTMVVRLWQYQGLRWLSYKTLQQAITPVSFFFRGTVSQQAHPLEGVSYQDIPTSKSLLSIIYFNARSLLPNIDELRAIAEADSPNILCVVESWLSNDISDNELAIDQYQILRPDRDRHGGGVLMYVHCSLSPRVLSAGDHSLELLAVSVSPVGSNSNSKFCISLFHRPPSSGTEVFESLSTALQSLSPEVFNSFVLIGDFNVDYLCTHSFLYKRLFDCLSPFSLCQIVPHATHESPNGTSTLIDLAFIPNPSQLRCCTVIPPLSNSDHNGIQLDLVSPTMPARRSQKARTIWKYGQADFEKARHMIESTDWDALLTGDVNTALTNWQGQFLDIMEQFIPKCALPRRRNLPWLSKKITQAIRKRNHLFKRAKRSGNSDMNRKYRIMRNRASDYHA